MKRTTALVMALAMILTLAACGGKNADQPSSSTPPVTQGTQDQPSSSTPPVTQGTQDQPNNTPADNTQPSEPADATPNEPQGDPGAIPKGSAVLYDGEHYVMLDEGGENSYAAITGKKIPQSTISIDVSNQYGNMTVIFGDDTPMSEAVSAELDGNNQPGYDNWLSQNIAPGEFDHADVLHQKIGVFNAAGTEQTVADCNIVFLSAGPVFDGQLIETFEDVLNLYGAPTAVCIPHSSPDLATYIWQFENFFLAVSTESDVYTENGEIFYTEEVRGILGIVCYKPSEAINNAFNNNLPGIGDIARDATEALTVLGLL